MLEVIASLEVITAFGVIAFGSTNDCECLHPRTIVVNFEAVRPLTSLTPLISISTSILLLFSLS